MKHARTIVASLAAALMATIGLAATGGAPAQAAANTTLTLQIPNCEGCVIGLVSVMAADYEDLWQSKEKKVKDGEVTFKVPVDRTDGLSIGVSAPWEGGVPAHTIVAMRYKGYDVGDKVSYSDIKTAKKASGCWAGTTETEATLKVIVKKVTVQGNMGPVAGSIAFAKKTQPYLQPMQPTFNGVLATQDVFGCGPDA
jgi:hypothetical protein